MSRILRRWAGLGSRPVGSRARPTDWAPARRLAAAAGRAHAAYERNARALLTASSRRLRPLADPLAVDLGAHRWLAGGREEVYSDWLHWVVGRLLVPAQLFDLLRLPRPAGFDARTPRPPQVRREVPVPHGHPGRSGRLDLVVTYPGAAVVLEVKVAAADAADTAKQRGYTTWLDGRRDAYTAAVLVATAADEDVYEGFRFLSWADLCVGLRRQAVAFVRERRVVEAAMTLAYAGAVEQNLLKLPGPGRAGGRSAVVAHRLEAHLRWWLECVISDRLPDRPAHTPGGAP